MIDYKVHDLYSDDFKFNLFGRQPVTGPKGVLSGASADDPNHKLVLPTNRRVLRDNTVTIIKPAPPPRSKVTVLMESLTELCIIWF